MVQITSSIVLAALLAAPSFAAPVAEDWDELSARDPRIAAALGKIKKVFTADRVAAAAGVAGAGGVIAGAVKSRDLDFDDLEIRDPAIGATLGKIKKVLSSKRIATVAGVASAGGVIAGAAKKSSSSSTPSSQPAARDLDFDDLEIRDPAIAATLGKIKKVLSSKRIATVAGVASAGGVIAGAAKKSSSSSSSSSQPAARDLDFDDLEIRDPRIAAALGKIKKVFTADRVAAAAGVAGAGGVIAGAVKSRDLDFDDLEIRDPAIGATLGKIKKVLSSKRITTAAGVASAGGVIAGTAKKYSSSSSSAPSSQPAARDLDFDFDLEARDPRVAAALAKVRKVFTADRVAAAAGVAGAGGVIAGAVKSRSEEPSARDLELLIDLLSRDFHFDELD
ncbi:unnamed protein product [Cyclocybe aegerita]|uniref:Uncharacterized protein n=1 Tax=Cyclocybe aegerita TaxID=1973307 RepID=A0A8S0VSQ5_CYCAE|nr:unnamed protein product [Cyclocybe aegerita]